MSNNFFKSLSKSLGDGAAQLAADGIIGGDPDWHLDSGSYTLNALMSGSIYKGMANNIITSYAGTSGVGKTFFALFMAKRFLEDDSKNMVVYFESEGAITQKMLEERNIDLNRFIVIPVITIQEFRKKILDTVKTVEEEFPDSRIFTILDSLGNLSTTKEIEDTADGKETKDMTRAQIVKATFRVLTLRLAKLGVPLLVTNHTYKEMGLFPKEIPSGGSGIMYCSSTIVLMGKAKYKDGTDQVGVTVRCTVPKSRMTIENSQIRTNIHFQKGLNRYYGLLDIALAGGVLKKDGSRFLMPDGKLHYEKSIYNNPEKFFDKKLLDEIDAAANKLFSYGADKATVIGDNGEVVLEEGKTTE